MHHLLAALTLTLAGTAVAEPYSTTEFTHAEGWTGDHVRRLADVDGDGRKDIVGFHDDGVWVALARETGFERSQMWSTDFGNLDGWLGRDRFAADVNGDGKADLIGFAADRVVIAHSTGTGFEPADWTPVGANMLINGSFEEPAITGSWQLFGNGGVPGWHSIRGPYIEVQKIGLAVDGAQHLELSTDQAGIARQIVPTVAGAEYQVQFAAGARAGLQENIIAAYWNGSRLIRVSKDGRQASPDWEWHSVRVQGTGGDVPLDFHTEDYIESWKGGYLDQAIVRGPEPLICANDSCDGQEQHTTHLVGDVNGDGLADLVGIGLDGVYVSLAFEKGFLPKTLWNDSMVFENGWQLPMHRRRMADINGDGMDDLIGVGPDGIVVAFSSGTSFDGDAVALGEFGYNHGWRPWSHPIEFGDFDGDGHADLVGFSNTRTHMAQGHGNGIYASRVVDWGYGPVNGWDIERNPRLIGDVNGDGLVDMVAFGDERTIVRISDGTRLTQVRPALSEPLASRLFTEADGFDPNRHRREVGDVNGDGRLDLVMFHERGVMVALGTGAGFSTPRRWSQQFCILQTWWTGAERYLADFNGDGLDDIIGFGGSDVMVALSDGENFGQWFSVGDGYRASDNHFGYKNPQFTRHVGDFNGDGLTDVLGFRAEGVYVSLSDGTQIGDSTLWLDDMTLDFGWDATFEPRAFGDINGDGMDDLVGFSRDGVQVAFSTGDGFDAPVNIIASFGRDTGGWGGDHARRLGDIDGDGDDDIVGFGSASIYVYRYVPDDPAPRTEIVSNDMTVVAGWRQRHDRFVADVDGDGLDDAIGFGPRATQVRLSNGDGLARPQPHTLPVGTPYMSTLRPLHTNACLWAPADGGDARQLSCGSGGWMASWTITMGADGSAQLRTIDGECLRADGPAISAGSCVDARWMITRNLGEDWSLSPRGQPALCLGVADGSTANAAPLELTECAALPDQRWRAETLHTQVREVRFEALGNCLDGLGAWGACPGASFELIDTGMGGDQIRSPLTGQCFEHVDNSSLPRLAPCARGESQLWAISPGDSEPRLRAFNANADLMVQPSHLRTCASHPVLGTLCTAVPNPGLTAPVGVSGFGGGQLLRVSLHTIEFLDGPHTILSLTAGERSYVFSDPEAIIILLAQRGVRPSRLDIQDLFPALSWAERDALGDLVDAPGTEPLVLWGRVGTFDGDTMTLAGPANDHAVVDLRFEELDGYTTVQASALTTSESVVIKDDSIDVDYSVTLASAGVSWGDENGSQAGIGISAGVGFSPALSVGQDGRYGGRFDVEFVSIELYVHADDFNAAVDGVVAAGLFVSRGVVWIGHNIGGLLSGALDFGVDLAEDVWGGLEGAVDVAGDGINDVIGWFGGWF